MKQFNKSIKIEISLDSMAQNLLGMMRAENNPHAELVVETIMSCMQGDGQKMGLLYNSMVGWSNDINYAVGEKVVIHRDRANEYSIHTDCPTKLNATIEEIDIYRGDKNVKVEYHFLHNSGAWKTGKEWIRHTDILERLPEDAVLIPGTSTNSRMVEAV